MNKMLIAALAGAALGMVAVSPAAAHHSGAMYDRTKTVELAGKVVEFQYTNPHSWLIIEVANDDGTTTNWGFEAEGPGTLMRQGIGKGTFPVGLEITVRGSPMKDGRPAGAWIGAIMPDGSWVSPSGGPPPADLGTASNEGE